jgi:hypothetical protein
MHVIIIFFFLQNANIQRQEYLFAPWPGTPRTKQKYQSGLGRLAALALPGPGLALPGPGLALTGPGLALPGLKMSLG